MWNWAVPSDMKRGCFGELFPQFADVSMSFVKLSAMKKGYCRWGHCWNRQNNVTGMLLFPPFNLLETVHASFYFKVRYPLKSMQKMIDPFLRKPDKSLGRLPVCFSTVRLRWLCWWAQQPNPKLHYNEYYTLLCYLFFTGPKPCGRGAISERIQD